MPNPLTSMLTLVMDTAHTACSVGIFHGDTLLSRGDEEILRGQAQLLPGLVQAVGGDLHHINQIIVGVGPGSFTGIRVGLSFAKGLAKGLGIPLWGVDGFVMTYEGRIPSDEDILVVLDAKRKDLYCQLFPVDSPPLAPQNLTAEEIADTYDLKTVMCLGSGTTQLEAALPGRVHLRAITLSNVELIFKAFDAGKATHPANPFYLRAADVTFSHT